MNKTVFLSVLLLNGAWIAFASGLPLKIEVTTPAVVFRDNQEFDVNTRIENIGNDDQVLHLSQCSYSSLQWAADNPSVHVKEIFCKKNQVIEVRLKPGEVYERRLPVSVSVRLQDLPRAIIFRVGFRPWDGETSSTPASPIWSNPLTIDLRP